MQVSAIIHIAYPIMIYQIWEQIILRSLINVMHDPVKWNSSIKMGHHVVHAKTLLSFWVSLLTDPRQESTRLVPFQARLLLWGGAIMNLALISLHQFMYLIIPDTIKRVPEETTSKSVQESIFLSCKVEMKICTSLLSNRRYKSWCTN